MPLHIRIFVSGFYFSAMLIALVEEKCSVISVRRGHSNWRPPLHTAEKVELFPPALLICNGIELSKHLRAALSQAGLNPC